MSEPVMTRRGFNQSICAAALLLTACGGSSEAVTPLTPKPATTQTSDPNATADAQAVQRYLAALTNGDIPGVMAGQNAGHGSQINDPSGLVGYAPLVEALGQSTGQLPAIVGIDYEHDLIFTPAQLAAANATLAAHWQAGGLVTINWSPQNPWLNDESDLVANQGVWTNTRTSGNNMANVKLGQLIDPTSAIFPVWRRKLDRIATALQDLQQAGVVVLWRPMQEMNGNWFWWGSSTQPHTATAYAALWQDMHRYFTQDKGLHNLLWVYSPTAAPTTADPAVREARWAYPGDAFVDVVAGTAYNDSLDLSDYLAYRSLGKPMGMGELGPQLGSSNSFNGQFDDTLYSRRLQSDFPAVAYWVSWHNYQADSTHVEHLSISSQRNAAALLQDVSTITLSRLGWKGYR
ncbi:MAG: glycosyl hydrolase [Rhizobacter sp.]